MLVALASYYLCYARFNLKLSPEELISIDAEVLIQILDAPFSHTDRTNELHKHWRTSH